jgi:hypothetical protein
MDVIPQYCVEILPKRVNSKRMSSISMFPGEFPVYIPYDILEPFVYLAKDDFDKLPTST